MSNRKQNIKYNVEYEEAPSGNVTFYNYKEPLMKFEGGYGFLGALVFDSESDKIQCHLCGNWYESLAHHLAREHAMTASEYKEHVGLRQSTALISEKMRAKLIASGLDKRLQNLRNHKGRKWTKEQRERIAKALRKNTAETQNERNTCPMQLLARLKAKYIELGRQPSEKDKGCGFIETIRMVYGSMEEACRLADIPYRKPGQTIRHGMLKYTREKCVEWVYEFLKGNDRLPKASEIPRNLQTPIYRYGKQEIFQKAVLKDGQFRKVNGFRMKLSKEELIALWKNFEKIHGRKPSTSDCKRGLLPATGNYYYHFKNWQRVVEEATK